VGHESEGSILAALKREGWANSLGSMLHTSAADFAIFSATIGLTDLGLEHVNEVAAVFFDYIGTCLTHHDYLL
jgi:insulysin